MFGMSFNVSFVIPRASEEFTCKSLVYDVVCLVNVECRIFEAIKLKKKISREKETHFLGEMKRKKSGIRTIHVSKLKLNFKLLF